MTNVNSGKPGTFDRSSNLYSDRYDEISDGSFGEAYEEYYDTPLEPDAPATPAERASSGGRHRRRDEDDYDFGASAGAVSAAGAAGTVGAAGASAYTGGDLHTRDAAYGDTVYSDRGYGGRDYVDDYSNGEFAEAEYPEEEYADGYPADEYVDQYEDAYDDRTVMVPAVRASRSERAGSSAVAAGSVPKRGLAMILIAVAALLGLWGLYAMMQKDSSGDVAQEQAPEQVQNANGQNSSNVQSGHDGNELDPAAQNDSRQNASNDSAQTNQADNRTPEGAAPAASGQAMTAENETINVYNNSTVPNLAAEVSDQLKGQGVQVGEVGNIGEQQAVLEQNTVFFDPATPGAEERARVLADRVGGVARANDPTVPSEANNPGSLTLVLTGPVNL